jgi:peptidoglycan/xylan/chitin deacetylase (PgdA/CDA1 family)
MSEESLATENALEFQQMTASIIAGGKREILSRGIVLSGIHALLLSLPARDSLLVLNHHRIDDPETDPWDSGLISATPNQLYEQVAYLKKNHELVGLDEALSFVDGTPQKGASRCRILITFDDGYLDNYVNAFPILQSLGVPAVFFLCSGFVGTDDVPWWDKVAYMLKRTGKKKINLHYPAEVDLDLEETGLDEAVRLATRLYRSSENREPERFIDEFMQATAVADVPGSTRRFLDWNEARGMVASGMAMGAHTQTHRMLSKLSADEQREELVESRRIIEEQLGVEALALAYPYGTAAAFTETTQQIAEQAGYRAAFSYHGTESNKPGSTSRFDIKRVSVDLLEFDRFRVQTTVARVTGKFWP